jgi:hypothetical protein
MPIQSLGWRGNDLIKIELALIPHIDNIGTDAVSGWNNITRWILLVVPFPNNMNLSEHIFKHCSSLIFTVALPQCKQPGIKCGTNQYPQTCRSESLLWKCISDTQYTPRIEVTSQNKIGIKNKKLDDSLHHVQREKRRPKRGDTAALSISMGSVFARKKRHPFSRIKQRRRLRRVSLPRWNRFTPKSAISDCLPSWIPE